MLPEDAHVPLPCRSAPDARIIVRSGSDEPVKRLGGVAQPTGFCFPPVAGWGMIGGMSEPQGIIGRFAALWKWSHRYPNGRLAALAIAAPPIVVGMATGIERTQIIYFFPLSIEQTGKIFFGVTVLFSLILLMFACVRAIYNSLDGNQRLPTSGENAVKPPDE